MSIAALRWVIAHRAWTPFYLIRYLRLLRLKRHHRWITVQGMVFLGRNVELYARPGFGRIILGPWVHLGDGAALRCHEGTLRLGPKVVIGRHTVINCNLDVEIEPAALISDHVYIGDFDHNTTDLDRPIKDQGIDKAPVRIGRGSWLGVKSTILKGCVVGRGAVVAANAVVTRDVDPFVVVGGTPARVIGDRRVAHESAAATRAAVADIAAKTARAAAEAGEGDPG